MQDGFLRRDLLLGLLVPLTLLDTRIPDALASVRGESFVLENRARKRTRSVGGLVGHEFCPGYDIEG